MLSNDLKALAEISSSLRENSPRGVPMVYQIDVWLPNSIDTKYTFSWDYAKEDYTLADFPVES